MLVNFENYTFELTEEEFTVLPVLIKGLNSRAKNNPVKGGAIVTGIIKTMPDLKFKMTQIRLRKMINFLRTHSILPIIGTQKGYYISIDKVEIDKFQKSMEQRRSAIHNASLGVGQFIDPIFKGEELMPYSWYKENYTDLSNRY